MGARSQGDVFESNVLYDDAGASLARRDALLRLRRDTAGRVTYKQPAPQADRRFKVRAELETEVADLEVLGRIFEALGFHPTRVYEKWRETFSLEQAHLCLDRLPFGCFLEIEGPAETIVGLAAKLELPWPRRILLNYYELFAIVRREAKLAFEDITFANFEGLAIDIAPYRERFEAGV